MPSLTVQRDLICVSDARSVTEITWRGTKSPVNAEFMQARLKQLFVKLKRRFELRQRQFAEQDYIGGF